MPQGMAVQFPANTHPFDVAPDVILSNELLREPQRNGYSALAKFWQARRDPALVQLPVGCGKSGLMAILPFGNARQRVLLVAPNVTIRTALARAVDPTHEDCFWKRVGVPYHPRRGPFCAVIDGRDVRPGDCDHSHFVVANIQQIVASKDRWLKWFPADYFDQILIDEGHHNAAASWQKLFAKFTAARIVSMTATPFRGDGQDVVGELVYRYPFTQAMKRGYIKALQSLTVAPTQIFFTYRDDTRLHTLEEVLQLREDAWFRRGVALAPKCNWDIVRASAQRLLELRKTTGAHHQIIAATCSIEHAMQVNELYIKLGLRTRPVHSQLTISDRNAVLADLKSGRLDCIVQVEMLGEGFDHPPLSIAAIFRPFASLAPYVQFVGRIMRVLREGAPDHAENLGIVVSHTGLHVERHWHDFHQLDSADQQLFRSLIRGESSALQTALDFSSETEKRPRRTQSITSADLLNTELLSAPAARRQASRKRSAVERPEKQLKRKIVPQRRKVSQQADKAAGSEDVAEFEVNPFPAPRLDETMVGPQQKRRHLKVALQLACKGAVAEILRRLKVQANAWQLFRRVKRVGPGSNYVTVTKLIHQRLNAALNVQAGHRAEFTLQDTEQALVLLERIVEQLVDELQSK